MTQQTRLREVTSEDAAQPANQQAQQAQQANASLQLLLLALKTLSQRTILAIAALKGMVLAGSVFWLAMVVVESPTPAKLVGLGIYAAFILICGFMDMRSR